MQRISVVGNSGSGKSTVARAVAARLGVPHVELDALFHRPDWEPTPAAEFRAIVEAEAARPGWVIDGNYRVALDLVWRRADTVVWVDPSRVSVMAQITRRSLARVLRRTELWNGNRESWRDLLSRQPDRSIVMWAWTQHGKYRRRYAAALAAYAGPEQQWVRLRTRRQIGRWLASLADATGNVTQPIRAAGG